MTALYDMPDAVARGVLTGQKRRPRRRTEWIMMVIVQLNAFARHLIEVWRPKYWVSVISDIAVTLIVRDNEKDIRTPRHENGQSALSLVESWALAEALPTNDEIPRFVVSKQA